MRHIKPDYAYLEVIPAELRQANAFIAHHHRHHKPVQGHRFSLAVVCNLGKVRGVATIGRPVARAFVVAEVLEVTRCCTDGTINACSMLYSAAARVGRAAGYRKIQTYTLEEEAGVSLRAAGWRVVHHSKGGSWNTGKRSRRTDQPIGPKLRWEKSLVAKSLPTIWWL